MIRRHLLRRIEAIEQESGPEVAHDVIVKVSLLSKLLTINPDEWARHDVERIAYAALAECRDTPSPYHAALAAMIEERLPLVAETVGPEETAPEVVAEVHQFGGHISPAIALALIAVITDTVVTPPDTGRHAGAKARLLERLGLDDVS